MAQLGELLKDWGACDKDKSREKGKFSVKVEKILKGSIDLISPPSPSVKIQIIDGKISLRCKGKTLLGVVNKLLKQKVC